MIEMESGKSGLERLDILEKYLVDNDYYYERIDREASEYEHDWHQIIVYDEYSVWDVIWHYGSYGYKQGLLEICGEGMVEGDDTVEGWLTEWEIIKRAEKQRAKSSSFLPEN